MSYAYRRAGFGPTLTPAVLALIVANGAGFVLAVFLPGLIAGFFALIPARVIEDYQAWRVVSYLFLHADFAHLFFNMLGLYFFGPQLERAFGTRRFYFYYFLTGVGAGMVAVPFYAWLGDPLTPIMGASGAIFGILAAFALLYPNQPIYLYMVMPIKAKWLILFYAVMEFAATVSYAGGARSGVASVAHLAGMVIGYFYLRGFSDLRSLPLRWGQWRRRRKLRVVSRRDDDRGPTYH